MRVLLKSKTTFNTIEFKNVTNIAYSNNTYFITTTGGTTAYSANDYLISLFYN